MLASSELLRSGKDHQRRRLIRNLAAFLVCATVNFSFAETETDKRSANGDAETQAREVDLRPCSFQNVTPGETKVDEMLSRLGKPTEELEGDGQRTLVYQIDPFEKVEMFVTDGVVVSVTLHFKTPAAPTQVEHELQLKQIESTPVMSETGQLLGRAYPERGVLLSFDTTSKSHRAVQLILEPIAAELFVLRVQNDKRHRYEQNLADLRIAKQLDPTNPEVLQMLAETLAKCGETDRALETVTQVLEFAPGNVGLMLHKAELLARLDRLDEARDVVKGIVDDKPESPRLHARAEKLYGDLLSQGAKPDFVKAIQHHLAAIKLATPLANEKGAIDRVAAKELLIETYLAAAYDIGAGEWQAQETTTAKWLASARELSEAMIAQDSGDELWKLRVNLGALAVYAELPTSPSLDTLVSAVARDIQQLEEASGDPLFKRELQLLRARGLFDAASIAHRRERTAQARELATQALKAVEPVLESRELVPSERYLIGRLYFFVGSSIAVQDQRHAEAVKSYAKARKYLSADPPAAAALDVGRHAQRFVSMGASYFEAGQRELGVKLTREGLETLKEAAEAGLTDKKVLALPYSNLAAMYKVLGRTDEARELSEMASRVTPAAKGPPRR